MFIEPNARDNLMTLLRLAREEAEDLRTDLADIERAKEAASASLKALECDRTSLGEGARAGGESDRASLRRHRLFVAHERLELAGDEARKRLDAATEELKKLERLVAIGADASRCDVRLTPEAPRSRAAVDGRKLAS